MSLTDLHRKPGHLIRRLQQIAFALFMRETERLTPRSIRKAAVVVALVERKGHNVATLRHARRAPQWSGATGSRPAQHVQRPRRRASNASRSVSADARRHQQMDVIGRQHVGMNGAAVAARRFHEPVTIARVVVGPEEDGPAIVAALDHMQRLIGQEIAAETCPCDARWFNPASCSIRRENQL
jgi:hypothetical protein